MLEFKKIKENKSGVPTFNKEENKWEEDGRILINIKNYTLIECLERKKICILSDDFFLKNYFVLGSYEELKKYINFE